MGNVLVTGVTGNLGSELLLQLMRKSSSAISVIIRAASYYDALLRLHEIGLTLGLGEREISERVSLYVGDLAHPRFGLAPREYDALIESVDTIVHSAAALSLKLSYEDARALTLTPTEHMLDFALESKRLKNFILVSTIGVGGSDYPSVPEIAPLATKNFRNNYERIKFVCEFETISQLQGKVPLWIVRPSMILGDQVTGRTLKPQIFSSICHLLTGRLTRNLVPDLRKYHLDTIPGDFLAQALVALIPCMPPDGIGVLHFCSGDALRVSFATIEDAILAHQGPFSSDRKIVSLEEFEAGLPLLLQFSDERERKRLNVLPFLLDYFTFDQSFENFRTIEYLKRFGLTIPPAVEYLESSVEYVFSNPRRHKKSPRRAGMVKRAGNE